MRKLISIALICMQIVSAGALCASAEDNLINVVTNRTSEASSEAEGHESAYANDGINDNADYTYWQSTEEDENPYWQVDLGVAYQIRKIVFEPRKEAPEAEKSSFEIIGSNDKSFTDYSVLYQRKDMVEGEALEENIAAKDLYRYIRIRKTDGGIFSIGEISLMVEADTIAQGQEIAEIVTFPDFDDDEYRRYMIPEDVIGTGYEKYVSILAQLNIMRGYEDGSFKPYNNVTRAEFAAIVARALGKNITYARQTFDDVSVNHWAHSYIELCVEYGILKGTSPTTYEPDKIITMNEAMTIFVRMLGYEVKAQTMGGYPLGYVAVAQELRLYNGIPMTEEITRGDIAAVLIKVLETDIMQQTVFGDDIEIETVRGENLLKNNHYILIGKGVMSAAANTGLTEVYSKRRNDYFVINGVTYRSEIPNLKDYLGYNMEFYYSTDGDEPFEIVAAIPSKNNNVETIDAEENPYFSGRTLYWYEDGGDKKEYETIPSVIDVIYNGTALLADYKLSELIPTNGSLKLIDNNSDDKWDIIVVTDEKTYIVKWSSSEDEKIYVKNSKDPISFDKDDDIVQIIDGETGTELSLDDISEWNIISVAASKNISGAKVYKIYVSSEMISGSVSGKDDDSISIDGTVYELADSMDIDSIKIADTGDFYLDYRGRVAALDTEGGAGYKYGYLRIIAPVDGIGEEAEMRIFTQDGEFITFKAAEKATADGKSFSAKSDFISHIKTASGNTEGSQLIKFKMNVKNEVLDVETTATGTSGEELELKYDVQSKYYMNSGIVDMKFAKDENTILMRVPEVKTEEDEYAVLPHSYMENSTTYTFKAYDGNESNIMKLFLFEESISSGLSESAKLMTVEKITDSLNEKGEAIKSITGVYNGEYVTLEEYSEGIISAEGLVFGDIAAIQLTSDGKIRRIAKRFYKTEADKPAGDTEAANAISTESPQVGGPYSNRFYAYGTVMNKDGIYARVTFTSYIDYPEMLVNLEHSELKITVIDSEEKEVRLGTKNDVVSADTVGTADASKVFLFAYQGNVREVIVFK